MLFKGRLIMSLFENNLSRFSPLADRMRPQSFDDFVGQKHLLSSNSFLIRAINSGNVGSCIFYGPPGCGKTTIANLIATVCKGEFKKLNAVSSGVGDAKEICKEYKESQHLNK